MPEDEGPFELRLQAPEDLWRRTLLQRLPPPSPLAESAEEEVMEETAACGCSSLRSE